MTLFCSISEFLKLMWFGTCIELIWDQKKSLNHFPLPILTWGGWLAFFGPNWDKWSSKEIFLAYLFKILSITGSRQTLVRKEFTCSNHNSLKSRRSNLSLIKVTLITGLTPNPPQYHRVHLVQVTDTFKSQNCSTPQNYTFPHYPKRRSIFFIFTTFKEISK